MTSEQEGKSSPVEFSYELQLSIYRDGRDRLGPNVRAGANQRTFFSDRCGDEEVDPAFAQRSDDRVLLHDGQARSSWRRRAWLALMAPPDLRPAFLPAFALPESWPTRMSIVSSSLRPDVILSRAAKIAQWCRS